MNNGMKLLFAALAGALMVAAAQPAIAHDDEERLVIHVDENDKGKMNLALNNAENVISIFSKQGKKVKVEIVAYGPGLHMFRADKSPVKNRIEKMGLQHENLAFSACGVTQDKMKKKEGMDIPIMSEATVVPGGVIRIMELQDAGWHYLRP